MLLERPRNQGIIRKPGIALPHLPDIHHQRRLSFGQIFGPVALCELESFRIRIMAFITGQEITEKVARGGQSV